MRLIADVLASNHTSRHIKNVKGKMMKADVLLIMAVDHLRVAERKVQAVHHVPALQKEAQLPQAQEQKKKLPKKIATLQEVAEALRLDLLPGVQRVEEAQENNK